MHVIIYKQDNGIPAIVCPTEAALQTACRLLLLEPNFKLRYDLQVKLRPRSGLNHISNL